MRSMLIGLGTMVIGFFLIGTLAMVISGGRGDATGLATILSILYLSGVVATSATAIIKNIQESRESDNE